MSQASSASARRLFLGLTPDGGHTRVSELDVDERSHNVARSNTALYTRVQSGGPPAGALLHGQSRLPDSPRAWRLGQRSEELGEAGADRSGRAPRRMPLSSSGSGRYTTAAGKPTATPAESTPNSEPWECVVTANGSPG